MKRRLLTATVLLLGAAALNAQNTPRGYVTTNIQGSYVNVREYHKWAFGVGAGLHHMLGDKFSVGINTMFEIGEVDLADPMQSVSGALCFACFGKMADKLYVVPEVWAGVSYEFGLDDMYYEDPGSKRENFFAGISPFGLEFRASDKVGFRFNIFSIGYNRLAGNEVWSVSLNPVFSMNFMF